MDVEGGDDGLIQNMSTLAWRIEEKHEQSVSVDCLQLQII
jgi:hypothetical protein